MDLKIIFKKQTNNVQSTLELFESNNRLTIIPCPWSECHGIPIIMKRGGFKVQIRRPMADNTPYTTMTIKIRYDKKYYGSTQITFNTTSADFTEKSKVSMVLDDIEQPPQSNFEVRQLKEELLRKLATRLAEPFSNSAILLDTWRVFQEVEKSLQ